MVMKNGRGKLRDIVKIALIATVLMLGLTPLANAAITITITPEECNSCVVTTFTCQVTSEEPWSWQNTTIPANITWLLPTAPGQELVRTDFWNGTVYVGYVSIKSNNPNYLTQVDVTAKIHGIEMTITQPISYAPGATNNIISPFGGFSTLIFKVPNGAIGEEGFLNVSLHGLQLTNITDVYTLGICCVPPEQFSFHATASSDPVGSSDSLACSAQVPVYNTLGMAILVGIMSVVLGFATARRRK
jgi:hypothetical protein